MLTWSTPQQPGPRSTPRRPGGCQNSQFWVGGGVGWRPSRYHWVLVRRSSSAIAIASRPLHPHFSLLSLSLSLPRPSRTDPVQGERKRGRFTWERGTSPLLPFFPAFAGGLPGRRDEVKRKSADPFRSLHP